MTRGSLSFEAASRATWLVSNGRLTDIEGAEADLSATTTVAERWTIMCDSRKTPGRSAESRSMNPHFRDLLSALTAEGAEFLVVGAYALAVHGMPRATGDIDIWVRPTPDNARRVWQALTRFGAPLSSMTVEDFHTPD